MGVVDGGQQGPGLRRGGMTAVKRAVEAVESGAHHGGQVGGQAGQQFQ